MKFSENLFQCRRTYVLEYLGEKFNPINCNKMCDNCRNSYNFQEINVYDDIFKIMKGFRNGITYIQLVDSLHGKEKKKKKFMSNELEGLLKDWKLKDIENLIKELIF